jgi:anti-sigma factor RsiW
VEAYRRQNLTLHRRFHYSTFNDLPERYEFLAETYERALQRQRLFHRSRHCFAALGIVAAVSFAGWTTFFAGPGRQTTDSTLAAFTRQAVAAHVLLVDKDYPGDPMIAKGPPAKVFGWLSQQLSGMPQRAPDLVRDGFALAGGRILPTSNGAAMQLLYENKSGRYVTLFVGPTTSKRRTAFTLLEEDGVALVFWQLGRLGYSLIGNVDRNRLLTLADAVASGLANANAATDFRDKPRLGDKKPESAPARATRMPVSTSGAARATDTSQTSATIGDPASVKDPKQQ